MMQKAMFIVMVIIITGIQLQQDMVNMALVMVMVIILQATFVQLDGIYLLEILQVNIMP